MEMYEHRRQIVGSWADDILLSIPVHTTALINNELFLLVDFFVVIDNILILKTSDMKGICSTCYSSIAMEHQIQDSM